MFVVKPDDTGNDVCDAYSTGNDVLCEDLPAVPCAGGPCIGTRIGYRCCRRSCSGSPSAVSCCRLVLW